jgi:hypothetical protein
MTVSIKLFILILILFGKTTIIKNNLHELSQFNKGPTDYRCAMMDADRKISQMIFKNAK